MNKISIIIPIYNVEQYLPQCLDSIINQTYKNLEIILINDGSTDNSGKICDNYAKVDNRIHVFHKKNEGVSSARNLGLDKCTGDFIGFVDPDDFIELNMYEILYNEQQRTNADIVCLNNADELFNIQLNNNIIAAIPDTINTNKERFLDKKLSILNPSTHQYFNAGLLAINIPYWNKLNISENAINMLNSENFQCKDQDVLNILCTNQIKYLPKEYNCINLSEIKNIKNVVFLHLTISPKPWFLAYQISPYFDKIKYDYYMAYEKFTPYKDIPLQEPKTYKELEHYSKMLRKAGYPLQSIKYYFKYLITKVLKK